MGLAGFPCFRVRAGDARDPFIVYTSNVFAILGLRSLYFLLAKMMDRFHRLKTGLAVILAFVGVKMCIAEWMKIPTMVSLLVILTVLILSVTISLAWPAISEEKA